MKNSKFEMVVRYLLALILGVFGVDKFLHFMPKPEADSLSAEAGAYLGALNESGFIFPFIGVVFVVSAVLLAANRAVGFALVIVAPIVVNILVYHVMLDPAGVGPGALVSVLVAVLAWMRMNTFRPLFETAGG
ncbi:MAG: DoxX protein [Verrucomicrobiota bacterium]